jgi:hypothetical protein
MPSSRVLEDVFERYDAHGNGFLALGEIERVRPRARRVPVPAASRKVLGWPKRCKLAHAFLRG